MKLYKYINHTADLGIEVYGKTIEELFINIAKAIFETQIKGKVQAKKDLVFEISGPSLEELFIEWCRELLYNFSVKGFIPKVYKISISEDNKLSAYLRGEIFDPKRHNVKLEVKNATYHNFSIKKLNNAYCATVIFDV